MYLEAGSGADSPIPSAMVKMVKQALGNTLLIVGGGIRGAAAAAELVDAGADLIVTGTGVERSQNVASFVSTITQAIRARYA